MRQHLLRQSAKNTRPEFGCTTARKPGTARGCRERIGTAAATGVRQKRYGRPRKPCSQNRAAEIAKKAIGNQNSVRNPPQDSLQPKTGQAKATAKAIGSQKSGAETATKRLTTGNRTNKSRCKGDRQPKIRRRNHCKTVDNRKPGGQSRCKTIDSRQPVCRNH